MISGTRRVRSGLDNLGTVYEHLEGKRIGLLTGPAAIDRNLRHSADILHSQFHLTCLFAPEHGIRGDLQAGDPVAAAVDQRTGLPVHSLYGDHQAPTEAELSEVDVLVVDLQDVGARFYTYIYTLAHAMESCARADIPVVVLDRPNPLGGKHVEGCLLKSPFRSFVGRYAMPARYGLTIGEFAIWLNQEEHLGCRLTISRLSGWRRSMYFDETGLPWVSPSPNIPTVDSALAYVGTCLFEGTNLSEGRGTTRPFEQIGAPWLDQARVMRRIDPIAIQGAGLRPCWFRPTFSKHAGTLCAGIQLHVFDRELFRPYMAGIALMDAIRATHPDFAFLPPSAAGLPMIDLLAGTDELRLAFVDRDNFMNRAAQEAAGFAGTSKGCRLYLDEDRPDREPGAN